MNEIETLSSGLEQALLSLDRIGAEAVFAQCQKEMPLI